MGAVWAVDAGENRHSVFGGHGDCWDGRKVFVSRRDGTLDATVGQAFDLSEMWPARAGARAMWV